MPKSVTPLTATAISKAKPSAKSYKLRDGGGLYLLVPPKGQPRWCMDYCRPLSGQRTTLGFGSYPAVGLADARGKRDEARSLIAAGIDPGEVRKEAKEAARAVAVETANTFAAVAKAWATWKGGAGEGEHRRQESLASGYLPPA